MNVAPKVISVIRALYTNSKFMVEIDGVASEWYLEGLGQAGMPVITVPVCSTDDGYV